MGLFRMACDPEDVAEVMRAQRLLKELIEAQPVVDMGTGDVGYQMPNGTVYDTNDANPADDLEFWLERVLIHNIEQGMGE